MDFIANIDVDDLEAAEHFYVEAFGLRVGRRFGGSAVELLGASTPVYLLEKADGSSATPSADETRRYSRHWTPVHLDFVVDDIDTAVARAVRAGAVLEQPVGTHKWGKLALLADPFGHGLCLIEFIGRGDGEIAD
jgi:predicted enzyme related to lactoylglutathione lyase